VVSYPLLVVYAYLNGYSNRRSMVVMDSGKKQVKHLGYYCIGPTITPKEIERMKNAVRKDTQLHTTEKYFAVLAGSTRLKILYLLQNEKELCVCDIADILETTVSAVSHQLKILRMSGFIKSRKDAQTVFYSLSKESMKELKNHF